MSFYLYLSSDSSLDKFSSNTLAKFTNQLSTPIRFDGNWAVALQSISVSKAIKHESKPNQSVSKIYIHLNEIKKNHSVFPSNSLLKIINANENIEENYFHYEVVSREYYPVLFNEHKLFTVSLLDENNEKIPLLNGQPTFVKLKFKEMSGLNSFILNLSSSENKKQFPNNHASHFINQTMGEVALSGRWKVALTSIILPSHVEPIYDVSKLSMEVYEGNSLNKFAHIQFNASDFANNEHLQKVLIERVSAIEGMLIKFDKNGRLHIACCKGDYIYHISLNTILAHILGDNDSSADTNPLSFTTYSVHGSKEDPQQLVFDHKVDVQRLQQNIAFIYTDIMKPIHTAGSQTQLLKLLPLKKEKGKKYMVYESQHLGFVDLQRYNFRTIKIEIRRGDGALVKFIPENESVSLSLLFKRE